MTSGVERCMSKFINNHRKHMSKMSFALIGLGLLVVSLAPSNISAAKSSTSGVVGQVFIGPICPVVTPDRDCSDRPFQTTIAVYSDTGKFITEFMTTIDGRFQVTL